ncbi:ATP-binding protein [Acetobacteraceae bacterium H6797]|nr:ATP-binding protein [Acetobacteraceae bacterium H6797]
MSLALTAPATQEGLALLRDGLVDFLEAGHASPKVVGRAEVVLEEIALNALGHGGAREMRLMAAIEGEGCRLVFEDDGAAFDPLAPEVAPLSGALEDAPIGGLGLLLVRRLAADLRYEYTAEGRNRLTVALAA